MNNNSIVLSKSMRTFLDKCKWNIRQSKLHWLSRIKKWRRNVKTRKHLANLAPYIYQDIGLTDKQIRDEIQKKFWQ